MTDQHIPILDLGPDIEANWDEYMSAISGVVRSGRFILGPNVAGFEEEVAAYLGVDHAVGVNSGTDALVIALRALGIGAGHEVVTTPFTFFATAEAISIVGAAPVFVDIDPDSLNLDPARLAAAITPRTRALIPVHLFGLAADMDAVRRVAADNHLAIVEDVAQAFGGAFGGARLGSLGTVGAFSFFPSKNLGGFGDGGLVATNDAELATAVRKLRTHGASRRYHNEMLGYNSRLDEVQAAVLRVKLAHIDAANKGRRAAAERYNGLLADVAGVRAPAQPHTEGHVYHQYTIRVLDDRRDAVRAALAEAGIATMVYYPVPANRLPVYRHLASDTPHSDRAAGEVLSLPIWPQIEEAQQRRVVSALVQSIA